MINKALFSEDNKEVFKRILEKILNSKIKGIGFLTNESDKSKASTSFFIETDEGPTEIEVNSKIISFEDENQTTLTKHIPTLKDTDTTENITAIENELTLKINDRMHKIISSLEERENTLENDDHLIVLALDKSIIRDFCTGYKLIERFKNAINHLSDEEFRNILNTPQN